MPQLRGNEPILGLNFTLKYLTPFLMRKSINLGESIEPTPDKSMHCP
jgi:hypothetical protein